MDIYIYIYIYIYSHPGESLHIHMHTLYPKYIFIYILGKTNIQNINIIHLFIGFYISYNQKYKFTYFLY